MLELMLFAKPSLTHLLMLGTPSPLPKLCLMPVYLYPLYMYTVH
ncbi:hypothetical protein [Nocardia transvalensis]|nr:hypothetical protein [Nocardia transvalensis]